jgi:hypothetical protein
MKVAINKFKKICFSKWSIFTTAIGLFPFLLNIQTIIIYFTKYIYVAIIWIVIVSVMIMVHLYYQYLHSKDNNAEISKTDVGFSSNNKKIIKVVLSFTMILFIMTIGSLFYINKSDIYFVVVDSGYNSQLLIEHNDNYNKTLKYNRSGLGTRVLLRKGINKIILRNGYISYNYAVEDSARIKKILPQNDINIVCNRSSQVSLIRKVYYYQKHIVWLFN